MSENLFPTLNYAVLGIYSKDIKVVPHEPVLGSVMCSRSQKRKSAAFRHCRLSEKFSQDKLARSCFLKQRHPVDVN